MKFLPASILLFFFMGLVSCFPGKQFKNWDAKQVLEEYSGGHKWDITLTLYTDSTFRYVIRDDMLGIPKVKKGAYLKTDSTIDLYTWKRKFLSRKSDLQSCRLDSNRVKMYPPSAEEGENGNFVSTYFTLTLVKN